MATLLLSAAGSAIGGSFGGSIAGLTAGALGKAVGATFGAGIDQRLTGLGSEPVETGRVERFRVMGASEGAALPRVFGRNRIAGQVIWSSRFLENVETTQAGGKGGPRAQEVREFSYSISLALALCEGEVARVGRIWADGQALDLYGVTWRLHEGGEDQIPDPVIAAIEGPDFAPAYRGTAYVVFENLDLTPFGNRIPQFNFEVFRRPAVTLPSVPRPPALDVRAVALVPGTGEYALATTPVQFNHGKGKTIVANVNNDRGRPDLVVSLEQLRAELPASRRVSLVVSWFGDDLRCDRCRLRPVVEQAEQDGQQQAWSVSGVGRFDAKVVTRVDGRPLFGGTPSDASVIQAIRHMENIGQSVMFYPFILMEILSGNELDDPWTDDVGQLPVPWRGRITLSRAPGLPGSPDKTSAAEEQVRAFFGTARVSDFAIENGAVRYTGPNEWSYRRFILHYAHLCVVAGGVEAFCIGSEMRSLTQIRDGVDGYPAVRALCRLARDVREILGSEAKIGYAADWSEYFGHHPDDGSGDLSFHLDPLWAHSDIDFVGIDNYMPLSDWRDGSEHLDVAMGSIYNLDYIVGNVRGGEGFDWYYASQEGRENQERLPIHDGAYGDDWVFRYKDIRNWWARAHVNRVGGVQVGAPTAWEPRSKPIWFTELGCPAVDKGTNQPNVFYDPKSSESFFPYYSSGARDDFIQHRYLQAMYAYWNEPDNNPISDEYAGKMVDMARAYVWAWDARPWPDFPDRLTTWVDGANYDRGHWINARVGVPALAEIVAQICVRSDVSAIDLSALDGCVTGYMIGAVETARQSLQPLMLAYGFDSFSHEDDVAFVSRNGRIAAELLPANFAVAADAPAVALTRGARSDAPGRVTVAFVRADMDYQAGTAEAVSPDSAEPDATQSSTPIVMTDNQAKAIAERWLSESRIARDSVKFDLPLSQLAITSGDVVSIAFEGRTDLYRIDRVEDLGRRTFAAARIEPALYETPVYAGSTRRPPQKIAIGQAYAEFLDLPLLTGQELPHAPHIAVTKTPWTGSVAVFSATADFGYRLNTEVFRSATMGETLEPLGPGICGKWMKRGVRVRIASGSLRSATSEDVLNGSNAAALRHGGSGDWEVIQFASAILVGPNEYEVSGLLRGQAGTDAVMTGSWPAGTDFVLLDAAVVQLELPISARGLSRHYRVGPAVRPYDHASYVHYVEAFAGVGLRPYRPCQLSARRTANGQIQIDWIRRTRIDGDSWEASEAPVGEAELRYQLRIWKNSQLLIDQVVFDSSIVFDASDVVGEEAIQTVLIEVAQISDEFGPGPFERISIEV